MIIERPPTDDCGLVRTGQAHRTLIGHTAPVTCLQFDEMHVVSGSLDKTVRVCVMPRAQRLVGLIFLLRYGICERVALMRH